MESRQLHSSENRPEVGPEYPDIDINSEGLESVGNGDASVELFLSNPVFRSEKAQRALSRLKDVLQAAEENLPEELKNELRHERKTNPPKKPVHIGDVVADAPNRQPGLLERFESTYSANYRQENIPNSKRVEKTDTNKGKITSTPASIYRQAIVYGFSAALIALMIMFFIL